MAYESSLIEDQWRDLLFSQVGYTDRVFYYDVSAKQGTLQLSELKYSDGGSQPAVNFFLCLVTRTSDPDVVAGGGTATRYTYTVRVEYYLQQSDSPEETYRTHRDRLEAVDGLVRTALDPRWGGTIDYRRAGTLVPTTVVTIDEKACWRGGYTYTAVKCI